MTPRALVPLLLAAALAGACAGTPTRFYTLVPSAPGTSTPASSASVLLDVQSVTVPQQVDMPQLVLRQSDGEVAVVETRQWIAPLPDEIRDSLAQNLARRIGAIDVHAPAGGGRGLPVVRVRLEVTRFDSLLGREARLEGSWTVTRTKEAKDTPPLRCSSAIVRPTANAEYDALVVAHQSALDALAAQIAAAVSDGACPRS